MISTTVRGGLASYIVAIVATANLSALPVGNCIVSIGLLYDPYRLQEGYYRIVSGYIMITIGFKLGYCIVAICLVYGQL
jgi:hypothetical protein